MNRMAKKEEKTEVKKNGSGHHYDASDISVLEGLEPVRKLPGMYIGTTGIDGLHHLVWEIFDNSRDEAMGGFADRVEIALLPGNRVRVADNGRGIPVDIHKKTKVSALETVMTTLHAGGKFGGAGYKVSGGLHGVGASVVNALSLYAKVEVHRDGGAYAQEYARGKRKAAVKKIASSKQHGTIVTFQPDPEIFPEIKWDWHTIVNHMRQQAYLVKGMKVDILDFRNFSGKMGEEYYLSELGLAGPSMSFYFEGGLISLVKFYNQVQKPIHKNIFYVDKRYENVQVEVALQYIDDITTKIAAFANNTYNAEGGTHVTGFKTALTRLLNSYGRKNNIIKEKDENFTGDDVLEGLTAVISVKLQEIQFEGQTKAKLGSVEAQSAVNTVFGEAFEAFLEENPDDARDIIGKSILAMRSRKAAKAAKDSVLRKGALEGMTLPGKLADCQTRDASEAELFIVEGDSAGGCFSGDTKVALLDGRNISFEEIAREYKQGKKNYCYTIGASGDIEVAEIKNPRVTRKNTGVIKLILDNGEEIICTPDHRFMLRDGNYKQAHELSPNDSLMPLYRQISVLDIQRLSDEVVHFNHRIVRIEAFNEKIDVYDIEVPETHNFALSSGVFVHNSSKQGRDRRTQAILPLKGKILNVERARLDKMLTSVEIKSLVVALGTAIGDAFDISRLRYHKIIIATDADVDGAHIRTLLLTLFYRYFKQLIEGGFIYIAQPPLYKIKKGKEIFYFYNEEDKAKFVKKEAGDISEIQEVENPPAGGEDGSEESEDEEDTKDKKKSPKLSLQRYKGLGEMNPEELWETTMDPARRILKKVSIEDAEDADKVFITLMGTDVPARKSFIQSNAKMATIDI